MIAIYTIFPANRNGYKKCIFVDLGYCVTISLFYILHISCLDPTVMSNVLMTFRVSINSLCNVTVLRPDLISEPNQKMKPSLYAILFITSWGFILGGTDNDKV